MKRTTAFISILLALLVFVCSCGTTNQDKGTTESSTALSESSQSTSPAESLDESDEASENSQNSDALGYEIPEFNADNVLYNPDTSHTFFYAEITMEQPNYFGKPEAPVTEISIEERFHSGLEDYVNNNELSGDAWFCVRFAALTVHPSTDTESVDIMFMINEMPEYLKSIGVVFDEELTEAYKEKDKTTLPVIVGYITKDMLLKITNDGNGQIISFSWLAKPCADAKECSSESTTAANG